MRRIHNRPATKLYCRSYTCTMYGMATITTQARRLTRQHNNDERLVTGYIYLVKKETGEIVSARERPGPDAPKWMQDAIFPFATWAASVTEEMKEKGYMLIRIGHGRLSEKGAQSVLDGDEE